MPEAKQNNMHSESENFLLEDTNIKKGSMEKINLAIRIAFLTALLTIVPVKEVNASQPLEGINMLSESVTGYSKNIWRKVRRDWYKKLEEYGFDKKERKIKLTRNDDEFIITVNAGKYTETRTIDNTGKFKDIIDTAIAKMLKKIQEERFEGLLKKTIGRPNYNNKNTDRFRIGDVYGVVINRDQAKYILNVINGRAVYGFGNNTADALGEIIKKIEKDPSAFKISRNAYKKTRKNYKDIINVDNSLPFNGELIHDEEDKTKDNYLILARALTDKNIPLSWFKDTDIVLNERGSGYIVTLVFKDGTKIVGTSPLAKVALIRAIDELYKHKKEIIDQDKEDRAGEKRKEKDRLAKERIEEQKRKDDDLRAKKRTKESKEKMRESLNHKITVSKLTEKKEVKKEIIVNLSRDEREKLGKKLPKEIRGHSYCVSLVSALIKFGFKDITEAIDSVDKVTINKSENTTTVLLLKSGQKITASINTTRKNNGFRHPASLMGDAHSSLLKKIEGSSKKEPVQKIAKITEKNGKWRIKFKIGEKKYRRNFKSKEEAMNWYKEKIRETK